MAGHSKWNNIKARKGKQDAKRGKVFTKIGREIQVAVKEGGDDIESNARLRDAVAKARANNMPNDTIKNAIKKASGAGNEANFEEIVYEGYGPNGIAVIVESMTDNRNRTAAEVRHAFEKSGGNLGTKGSVSYLFNRKAVIVVEKEGLAYDQDELMLLVIDGGAEEFRAFDEVYEIEAQPQDFGNILSVLEENGIKPLEAEIKNVPDIYIAVDEQKEEMILTLVDRLEDLDDVQNVSHNMQE